MNILLLHAKINFDNMEPLGLLSLATALKTAGHCVRVADIFPGEESLLYQRVRSFRPQLIGYSIETPGFAIIQRVNRRLREISDACFCAGGVHASVMPEETLRALECDFVMIGEAETSFPYVVDAFERNRGIDDAPGLARIKNDRLIINDPPPLIENLDAFAPVDRTLLADYRFYFLPPGNIRGMVHKRCANIMASRGCPYRCSFCESRAIMGRRIRRRSVNNVVDEMIGLRDRYGIKAVYFTDDIFAGSHAWIRAFCSRLHEKRASMSWGCQCRADSLTEQLVKTMKAAGCEQIDMGVESGDPAVLLWLNKDETVDQMIQAAEWIHRGGIRLLCSFVLGAAAETERSFGMTKKLIHKLRPSMCQYFTLTPYPGTKIHADLRADGKIPAAFSERFSQKHWDEPSFFDETSSGGIAEEKKALQSMSFFKDHRLLIIGWLMHPRLTAAFFLLFAAHAFFLRQTLQAIQSGNFVRLFQTIYAEFNKRQLKYIRKQALRQPHPGNMNIKKAQKRIAALASAVMQGK